MEHIEEVENVKPAENVDEIQPVKEEFGYGECETEIEYLGDSAVNNVTVSALAISRGLHNLSETINADLQEYRKAIDKLESFKCPFLTKNLSGGHPTLLCRITRDKEEEKLYSNICERFEHSEEACQREGKPNNKVDVFYRVAAHEKTLYDLWINAGHLLDTRMWDRLYIELQSVHSQYIVLTGINPHLITVDMNTEPFTATFKAETGLLYVFNGDDPMERTKFEKRKNANYVEFELMRKIISWPPYH